MNNKLLLIGLLTLTALITYSLTTHFNQKITTLSKNNVLSNTPYPSPLPNSLYIKEGNYRGYDISTLDINNDGKDEMIIEDMSASWWRNTFILSLEQEPVREWDSYKPKLVLFCKTCRFSYQNGNIEFKDLNGDGIYELIVTGGIEIPESTSSETEYRKETYFFENGDFIKKESKVIDSQ